jgi:hypothetical protein
VASGVTSASFDDTSVQNEEAYYYVVTAVNSAGEGPDSAEVSATPTASTSLTGYWKFDETDGMTAYDSSTGGNSGGFVGAPQWSTPGVIGPAAARFPGNDDYIKASSFTWPNGGPVTVCFWAKVDPLDVRPSSVFAVGDQPPENRFQAHVPWSDGVLYWDYGSILGDGRISVPYAPYLGKWTFVTLVSAGTGGGFKAIYLDGVRVQSAPVSDGPSAGKTVLEIGRCRSFGSFVGLVDDFRLYDRVLADGEIADIFALGGTTP